MHRKTIMSAWELWRGTTYIRGLVRLARLCCLELIRNPTMQGRPQGADSRSQGIDNQLECIGDKGCVGANEWIFR